MKYLYPTDNHFEIQSLASSDAQEDYEEDKKGNKLMSRSQVASCAQARVNELEQGHKDLTDNMVEFREIYVQTYSQAYPVQMKTIVTQNEDGSFDDIECSDCHEILKPADQGVCCPFCGNAKGKKIYTHWMELEKEEGDIGQLCQDIAQLEDDPQLEYTQEHNYTTDQEYYDIRFNTVGKINEDTCKNLENRKGVLNVGFNCNEEEEGE